MTQLFIASIARIADFDRNPYDVRLLEKSLWESGDYVRTEVTGTRTELYAIESCTGEMLPVQPGDQVIGALGHREATLEGVGSYLDVRQGKMHALTSAGLLGAFTSYSVLLPRPLSLHYRGHIVRDNRKITMRQFAIRADKGCFAIPTILVIGTSMMAGKTITGRRLCEVLSSAGFDVVGAKLTGAGRYRDIASFKRAGAAHVFDFVDVGLPSTVVSEQEFRVAIRPLLSHIDTLQPDYVVAETGASPLEPYNVAAAMQELGRDERHRSRHTARVHHVSQQQARPYLNRSLSAPVPTSATARGCTPRCSSPRRRRWLFAPRLAGPAKQS